GMWTGVLVLLIVLGTAFSILVELLNLSRLEPELPAEMAGIYDAERYKRSQEYLRGNTRTGIVRSVLSAGVLIAFVLGRGFDWAGQVGRGVGGESSIRAGLVFAGVCAGLAFLFAIPFRVYSTFVIEARFGFNRTTPVTFVMDLLKGILVGALIGG